MCHLLHAWIAQWVKLRGSGLTAFTDLLVIEEVSLSYPFEVYFCHILECVNTLFGDPEFAPILLLVPKHHYANANHTIRVYFDINVGKWW